MRAPGAPWAAPNFEMWRCPPLANGTLTVGAEERIGIDRLQEVSGVWE